MGKIIFEIDDDVFQRARQRAEATGTNVEQLVLEFLKDFIARCDPSDELARLSRAAKGNSRGWKFNREELHDRKL